MISGPAARVSAGSFFKMPIFFGTLQFLLLDLGLDPVPSGGRVGVRGFGLFRGGAGGGTGRSTAEARDCWAHRASSLVNVRLSLQGMA
jgi:hypothetical protein